jgi:hypothetical protein
MPRDRDSPDLFGRIQTISVERPRCDRRGRYRVRTLVREIGPDARLTDWLRCQMLPEPGTPSALANAAPASRPRLLSKAEIVRALRRYSGDRRVPLAVVASLAGLSRQTLYELMRGTSGVMTEATQARLSTAISEIEDGAVRIRRRGQRWEVDCAPNPLPPPQDKLVRAADLNEWARCRSCGGRWFSPVIMNGTRWFFCDQCLPPAQYPALGARPAD